MDATALHLQQAPHVMALSPILQASQSCQTTAGGIRLPLAALAITKPATRLLSLGAVSA